VRGTTEGINLAAQSYVKPLLSAGDEIIPTHFEHHANIVPWQMIAQETGVLIKVAPVDDTGQIILSRYAELFSHRTKFVSVTHVSNALGTITPVREMVQIAHGHGVRILIDGAQPILRRFGPKATVRPTIAFYNTTEEIDKLASAIRELA